MFCLCWRSTFRFACRRRRQGGFLWLLPAWVMIISATNFAQELEVHFLALAFHLSLCKQFHRLNATIEWQHFLQLCCHSSPLGLCLSMKETKWISAVASSSKALESTIRKASLVLYWHDLVLTVAPYRSNPLLALFFSKATARWMGKPRYHIQSLVFFLWL